MIEKAKNALAAYRISKRHGIRRDDAKRLVDKWGRVAAEYVAIIAKGRGVGTVEAGDLFFQKWEALQHWSEMSGMEISEVVGVFAGEPGL